jgi:hypothetical protein
MTPQASEAKGSSSSDHVEQIRHRMLRQLQRDADRVFDGRGGRARFPSDEDQIDPVVKDLYHAAAIEVAALEGRVEHLSERAVATLGRRLADPVRLRQPAWTVVALRPKDPSLEVPAGLALAGRSEQGEVEFSTAEPVTLHRVDVPFVLIAAAGEAAIVRNEIRLGEGGDDQGRTKREASRKPTRPGSQLDVYFPVVGDLPDDVVGLELFFVGDMAILDALSCGHTFLADGDGHFVARPKGVTSTASPVPGYVLREAPLRIRRNAQSPRRAWARAFFRIAIGPTTKMPSEVRELRELGEAFAVALDALTESPVRWLKVVVERGTLKQWCEGVRGIYTNCVAATSARPLTTSAYSSELTNVHPTGGGYSRYEYAFDLPLECCEVEAVRDQESGKQYFEVHEILDEAESYGLYKVVLRAREGAGLGPVLVLMPPRGHDPEKRPLRAQFHLLSSGTPHAVNGIRPGEIKECKENHPGIEAVRNVVPTGGAAEMYDPGRPAGKDEVASARAERRLLSEQDFVIAAELAAGAGPHDQRIIRCECRRQPIRARGAIVPGMRIALVLAAERLSCEAEAQLIGMRLEQDLSARSPANLEVRVVVELSTSSAAEKSVTSTRNPRPTRGA